MITFEGSVPLSYTYIFKNNPINFDNKGITIIIPVGGKHFSKHLEFCIRTIHIHNACKYEIIVVEEGDIPFNRGIAKMGVKYFFIESDKPFCKSKCFNKGVYESKFDIISGLDCDLLTPPNFFINGIKCLDNYDAAFVVDDILYTDKYPEHMGTFIWNNESWKNNRADWQFHGGSFFILKDMYLESGGFCEEFIGYGSEDSEFYTRIHAVLRVSPKRGLPLLHMKHDNPYCRNHQNNIKLLKEICEMNYLERVSRVKQSNTYAITAS